MAESTLRSDGRIRLTSSLKLRRTSRFQLGATPFGLGATPFGLGATPFGLGATPFGLRPHTSTPHVDPTRRPDKLHVCDIKNSYKTD